MVITEGEMNRQIGACLKRSDQLSAGAQKNDSGRSSIWRGKLAPRDRDDPVFVNGKTYDREETLFDFLKVLCKGQVTIRRVDRDSVMVIPVQEENVSLVETRDRLVCLAHSL